MDNRYKTLDFDKVKNEVASFTDNEDVKNFILTEEIDFNLLTIKRKLIESNEFLNFLKNANHISFDGIKNPCAYLNKASKNITLTTSEVVDFYAFHNHVIRIKKAINSYEELEHIKEYSDSLNYENAIALQIEKCIDANGAIKPTANDKLADILARLDNVNENITRFCNNFIKENAQYLQETNVCQRNDRTVFLFKNTFKNKFDGYDYGQSGSGLASYIEPYGLVVLNNKKIELEEARNREVEIVLKDITQTIGLLSKMYINDYSILVNVMSVYTKALYGYNNDGICASVDNFMYLQDVKHPLLDKEKVVPNTYTLDTSHQGIVISGINTGGKTISLKVIGLSICMSYLGIPIMAKEAIVPLYNGVYVDCDNNQSISDSLSTFSAHITTINEILKKANEKSLILIDELITGTDPKEAEAISLAILKYILELESAFVITTHYESIKRFAFDEDKILLSSVGFDEVNLEPTYHYIENSLGSSNAFDIAAKYLDIKKVLDEAKNIYNEDKSAEEKMFTNLSDKIKETDQLKAELNDQLSEAENNNLVYEEKLRKFEDSIKVSKDEIIAKFNEELANLKEQISNDIENASSKKQKEEVIDKIDDIKDSYSKQYVITYRPGDRVRVESIGKPGTITSINDENVTVDINGLTIKTDIHSLTLLPNTEENKKKYEEKVRTFSPSVLVVVGERVEGALSSVDSFLDKARLAGLKKIKIVHGVGTLALKNAIWERLMNVPYIDKYYTADFYDGGLAATIVLLK